MTFQKALSLSAGKESVIYLFIYLAILFNVDSNRKNIVYNKMLIDVNNLVKKPIEHKKIVQKEHKI